jgi:hypothetical protein
MALHLPYPFNTMKPEDVPEDGVEAGKGWSCG